MSLPATSRLAIIVPAHKTKYLREALASIAAQTEKDFQLYVFDDCSPEPVEEIVREFSGQLPLQFHRFGENLGKTSLVRHWERCLRLTAEPWLWIFSDDDVMEPGCVADFHAVLKSTREAHDLYRFNTVWIDGAGARISESPSHPLMESGADFMLARMGQARNASLQEIIFLRAAWESAGGIPDFPLAWHADESFTASLGVRRPLRTISGARVNWRLSGSNISNAASYTVTNRKIIASTKFFQWLVTFFRAHAAPQTAEIIRLSESWLANYLDTCWEFVSPGTCIALDRVARKAWGRPPGWGFSKGVQANVNLLYQKISKRVGARKGSA